jgi:AAA15 family ATPase/GTPase
MKILNVKIKGFRSLSNVTMNNIGPINIFYGENNAGKSNILAALEILMKVENVAQAESIVGNFLNGELSNFIDNFTITKSGEKANKINIIGRVGLDDDDLKLIGNFEEIIKTLKI